MNGSDFESSGDGSGSGADPCEDANLTLTNQILRSGVYVAAMLASLLANSLLICVVRRNRRMRSVTHYLIVNMAVADLLITVLHMPYMLQIQVTGSHQLHLSGTLATMICKVAGFSQDLSIACSVLSLVAIAFDRFLAVLFPLKKVAGLTRAGRVIAAVWLVSLALCAPLLYANKMADHDGEVHCIEDWAPAFDDVRARRDFTVVLFVVLYACPVILITALYSSIVRRVWTRTVLANAPRGLQHRRTTRKKVLKLLMVIVCLFVICWIPYHVVFFVDNFSAAHDECLLPEVVQFASRFFAHVNSAINPCLYFVILREYRRGLVTILCCRRNLSMRSRDISAHLSGRHARSRCPLPVSRKYAITKPTSQS